MNITVLGSSSGWAVPHRNPSGYLITLGAEAVLLDAGEGIARQLVRYDADLNRIQSVFISHTHADHVSGLFMFLQRLHLSSRQAPLRIFLPEGVLPGFADILPYFHIFPEKWSFDIEFVALSDGIPVAGGGYTLTPIINGHLKGNTDYAEQVGMGSDSYSFRVDLKNGISLIYTSDIDSLHHLNAWTEGVHFLISECTHIPIEICLDFARTFSIPRIVLTHIPPEIEKNIHLYTPPFDSSGSMKIEFAEDGLQIRLDSKGTNG